MILTVIYKTDTLLYWPDGPPSPVRPQARPNQGGLPMFSRKKSVSRTCRQVGTAALVVALAALAAQPLFALPPVCVVPDNGAGTADLPPGGCGYTGLSPMMIIDGLQPGTTVECSSLLDSFFDITYLAGGSLGGEVQQFHAQLAMQLSGTGSLAGFFRPAFFDVFCEMHSGPRSPGVSLQEFPHDLMQMQGQITGDPDFDLLRITGGTDFGLPSPGHTTLAQIAGGDWNVDSFFDITYRIDFVGHPGGPFSGMSGSTTGTIRMQCGSSATVPDAHSSWGELKALYR